MPTIKDIAREAGVSHGTVSNVINGRGNVSVENWSWRVEESMLTDELADKIARMTKLYER